MFYKWFIIPLEGFRYSIHGFIISLHWRDSGLAYSGFIKPLEGFRFNINGVYKSTGGI